VDADETIYLEFRHASIACYGRFRIDRTWTRWTRTKPTDAHDSLYELVFEIDESSEFDLMGSLLLGQVYTRIAAGEVLSASEVHRVVSMWLDRMRPTPGGGDVALACYCRRIGPADGEHTVTPGDWFLDAQYPRPGRPMSDMREAAPLVEVALRELGETESNSPR
jgi:hypothetical protein